VRPFRALLLDLDGTLVNSRAATEGAWRDWAFAHGLDGERVAATCHGVPSQAHVAAWAPELDAAAQARAIEAAQVASREPTPAFRGAFEVLRAMPPDRIAIVTSGTPELAHARLRRSGLPQPGVMVCAGDAPRGKPHPDPYLLGAELVGERPAECLVLEDAPAGVAAARAAGCQVEVVGARGRDLREVVPELRAARVLPDRDVALALVESAFPGEGWRTVPDAVAANDWADLGFLDAEAFAARAPAFMHWSLRHPDSASVTAETLDRELAARADELDPAQREAAEAWLAALAPWLD
jgi:sugar-phosphatase